MHLGILSVDVGEHSMLAEILDSLHFIRKTGTLLHLLRELGHFPDRSYDSPADEERSEEGQEQGEAKTSHDHGEAPAIRRSERLR